MADPLPRGVADVAGVLRSGRVRVAGVRRYATRVTGREDIGSWLSGPERRGGADGLGLPEQGRGSLGRLPRRAVALVIDWVACLVIAQGLLGDHPMLPLAVFAAMNFVFCALFGATFGHRVTGLRLRRLDRPTTAPWVGVGLWRALVRTVLLCLVIPAVVWDGDGRGMHDRAAGTVLVRR